MEPTAILRLPDGRLTLSIDPQRALSESELREELAVTNSRIEIIEDIVHRAKQVW